MRFLAHAAMSMTDEMQRTIWLENVCFTLEHMHIHHSSCEKARSK